MPHVLNLCCGLQHANVPLVLQAHTNIKMEDLFGSGVTSRTLTLEVNQEVRPIKHTPYTCTIWQISRGL
jgi:hypothetical protein